MPVKRYKSSKCITKRKDYTRAGPSNLDVCVKVAKKGKTAIRWIFCQILGPNEKCVRIVGNAWARSPDKPIALYLH